MAITFVDGTGAYGTADPLSVSAPSGIQDNDILYMAVITDATNTNLTWPSGFTQLGYSQPATRSMHVGWKRASGESGSYSVSAPTGTARSSILVAFRGISTGTPHYDQFSNTAYIISNQIIRAEQFTTTVETALIWFGLFYAGTGLDSGPGGFSLGEGTPNDSYRLYCYYKLSQAAGDTLDVDGDLSADGTNKHAFMVAAKIEGGTAVPTIDASLSGANIQVSWT